MKQNFNKLKLKINSNSLFLFSYFLYILTEVFDSSYVGELLSPNIRRSMKGIIIFLLLFQLFSLKKYTKKILFKYLLLCCLAVLVAFFSREPNVLVIVLLLLTCSNVKIESIINVSLYTMMASFSSIVLLSIVGILPDLVYSHYSIMTHSSIQAHSYGFRYYSTPAFLILFMSFSFLYKHKKIKSMIICLIANVISYYIFTAKLPLFCFIIFLGLNIIFKLNNNKFIRMANARILPMLPFALAILIYILSKYYDNWGNLGIILNSLLSGRLEQSSIGLGINRISILGNYFEMVGRYSLTYSELPTANNNFYIDSDYLYMMLHFGIIYSIFIIFCYSTAIRKYTVANNIYMLSWIISVISFAAVNWCLHNIEYNPLLFIGFVTLLEEKQKSHQFKLQSKKEDIYEFQIYQ